VHHPVASATPDMCGAIAGQPAGYSIPADNPFAGSSGDCGEIWLYGFRNPFRFSIDHATGDLFIGDVGQNSWEEIDWRPAGSTESRNYGWHCLEGTHAYGTSPHDPLCDGFSGSTPPILEYSHGLGCAVSGGYRYRGPVAAFRGTYVYGDACSSTLWFARREDQQWTSTVFDTPFDPGYGTVVGFGEDQAGNVYVVNESEAAIYRFEDTVADRIFQDGFDTP
jgi:glucose/arabinose dehydrogenase